MKKFFYALLCAGLFLPLSQCNQQQSSASDIKAEEDSLRKTDDDWAAAATAKNTDSFKSFVADDIILFAPNEPSITGKDNVGKWMNGFFTLPGFAIKWQPTKSEVANSADLGVTHGSYEFQFHDSTGKTITDKGKYITVWKKQRDGKWKVTSDIFNSDLPMK